MSLSSTYVVGLRKFIPIAVDEGEGCEGCAAASNNQVCAKLPKCSGRTFQVIFKEID